MRMSYLWQRRQKKLMFNDVHNLIWKLCESRDTIWHKFETSQVVIAADAEAIAFSNKNFKFCLFIYLLVRIVADVEAHVRIRALTSQHLKPLSAATKLNRFLFQRFFCSVCGTLVLEHTTLTHFICRRRHHIQRDKFLNDHKTENQLLQRTLVVLAYIRVHLSRRNEWQPRTCCEMPQSGAVQHQSIVFVSSAYYQNGTCVIAWRPLLAFAATDF